MNLHMPITIRKRPIIISFCCVLGFIISAGQIILISAPSISAIAGWYPIVYGLLTALRFMALVGTWHMKKWGAEIFTYTVLAKITVQVALGDFSGGSVLDAIFAGIFAVIFMLYYRRMDRNL
jgi:hypothetical protein